MLLSLHTQFQRILASCRSRQKCQQLTLALPSMMLCTLPCQAQICVASRNAAYSVSCNTGCTCQCSAHYFQLLVLLIFAQLCMLHSKIQNVVQSVEAEVMSCETKSFLWYTLGLCRLAWWRPFYERECSLCQQLVICSCRSRGPWSKGWMVCQP